jgi:non-specific protein-tyrosine kinase
MDQQYNDLEIDLHAYWRLLRRWLWLIVLAGFLAGGTAYAVSRWLVEPVYSATVQLVIQPSSSVNGSSYADILAGQRAALTYAEMLQSTPLQEAALKALGYTEEQVVAFVERGAPYDMSVTPVRDTQVIEVTIESTDPALAANFANTLVDVFIAQNEERQTARYRDTQTQLREQMQGVEQDLGRLKANLEATSDPVERGEIETQITQLQDSLSRLSTAYQNVQLAELQSADLVTVVEPARVPRRPIRPRTMMNILLAGVVGGMVAIGGVFLREYLDTSVKTSDEVQSIADLPVLGQIWYAEEIDKANGGGEHGIVINKPLSLTAEAYRLLRTNLQFTAVDAPLQVILVTSPGPSEGKSTISFNLALALAATGKRIILIDADMRRPKVCKYAGVEPEPGLSEALVDRKADLRKYLRSTDVMNDMRVLPPGQMPPNPTELLGSQRMGEMLNQLRQIEDLVVIIDSPPVLAAADALILASQVDGVLLALEAGRTTRQMLSEAVEQVRRSGARLLGTVLNKLPTAGQGGYHYYYYYYSEEEQRSIWPWARKSREKRRRSKKKDVQS